VNLGRSPAGRPDGTPPTIRLRRGRPDPAPGDLVIGAFVLARLLGLRLLTLEAQVVVHGTDHGGAGTGWLVLSPETQAGPGPSRGRPAQSLAPAASPSAGSERLARAVRLVEQGADTLERTRRVPVGDREGSGHARHRRVGR
jgi:hypothetical protein